MNSDEVPTVQPPRFLGNNRRWGGNRITLNRKTTTFATTNIIPPSNENEATRDQNKNKERHTDTDVITFKRPVLPEAKNTMTQRTIEVVTAAVIVNNRITTPVTLQLRPSKGSTNLNVVKAHQNIFSAMKRIDPTLKSILFKTKQLTPQINFHPPHQSTLPSSERFIKIQNHP